MNGWWKTARLSMVIALVAITACVSGGVDQPTSDGDGGTEIGTWTAGAVAMSGDESYTYSSVTLVFAEDSPQVSISASTGDSTLSWFGDYTRSGDTITTEDLPEVSAGALDLLALTASLTSETTLTGTLTESYPKDGRIFEVTGSFTAIKTP